MFYIVGLGNPGDKYEKTRHNVGRSALQYIVQENGWAEWSKNKNANALYTRGLVDKELMELFLPETFMNNSGETLSYLVNKEKASFASLIVVHDEVDLPFGEVKIAVGRGAGGNNGVQSIIDKLDTKDFVRVRIGISPRNMETGEICRPAGGGPLERFVLKPFSGSEQEKLPVVFMEVEAVINSVVTSGVEEAMNQYH